MVSRPFRGAAFIALAIVLLSTRTAAAAGFSEAASRGLLSALLFAFTAGFLTSLTPCVYPMIPITISIFGARKDTSRSRAVLLATLYVAGIAMMFGTLGTVFALLGKAFGTFLANPWVIVPLALFFVAMAFSMFGAFELALPGALQERLSRVGGRGLSGAFLMGLVGGLIAAPCTGPPLAGILAYVATTRNAGTGFALLATYAAGLGVPFWAIAGFTLTLPRSGPWMDAVKSVFGIALLVAALYYLKNVVPVLGHLVWPGSSFLGVCLGLVLVGLALGAVHLSFHAGWTVRLRKGAGVALVTAGLFVLTNWLLVAPASGGAPLVWLRGEAEAVSLSQKEGKPLLIDFMADWCLPCKEMDSKVFAHPEVSAALQTFVLLRIDATREDDEPAVGLARKKYGAETLPAVRLVSPVGQVVGEVNELVSPQVFLGLLEKARGAQ